MPTILVHHLERSRSHRVLWLLEELGFAYELVTYARDPKTMRAPKALRDVHPLGKSPVVTVDGVVFAESGAIVEHLVALSGGKLRPTEGEALRQYQFFLHYAEGSLMPPLLVALIMGQLRSKAVPFPVRLLTKTVADSIDKAYTRGEIRSHVAFLEGALANQPYAAGDAFSAADVMLSYPAEALVERGGVSSPVLSAYIARLRERPGYQAAIARGGPNMVSG